MTAGRLPFTLPPLPGEAFETWLHTYAARLDVTTGQLIEALARPVGRPTTRAVAPSRPDREHHHRARRRDRAGHAGRPRDVRRARSHANARHPDRVGSATGQPVLPGLPGRRTLETGLAAASAVLLPPPHAAGRTLPGLQTPAAGAVRPAEPVAQQPTTGGQPVRDQLRLLLRARPRRDRIAGLADPDAAAAPQRFIDELLAGSTPPSSERPGCSTRSGRPGRSGSVRTPLL